MRSLLLASVIVVFTGAAAAAQGSVDPGSVQTSAGAVTVTRTADAATGGVSYAVVLTGRFAVHGWSYTGGLSGASTAHGYVAENTSDIPEFAVQSTDGIVTGTCGGTSNSGELPPTVLADTVFSCLLSRDGATPWFVALNTALAPQSSQGAATTWSGHFDGDNVSRTAAILGKRSLGDAQVQQFDFGDHVYYTVQLSGQVTVGTGTYVGDIVSSESASEYLHDGGIYDIPQVDVSGSNDGHDVTGQCTGLGNFSTATSDLQWVLDCQLSLDGGPLTAVRLATTTQGGGVMCPDDDGSPCDRVYSGWFHTAGPLQS